MLGHRQTVSAAGAPAAIGPYSHAVRAAGELLFCSGQIPLDPATGELVGESVGEQARRCLENLHAVCAAAGTTLAQAVRLTIYMTDLARFAEVNEVCAEAFPDDPPARATVGVAALPRGAQVEIDAVVALPDGSSAPPPAGSLPATGAAAPGTPGVSWRVGAAAEPPGVSSRVGAAAELPGASSQAGAAAGAEAAAGAPASRPATGAVVQPAVVAAALGTAPGQVYHLELRHFPRNLCRFNLSARDLYVTVLAPWAADRPFELGELKWDPRQARLTVLEGPPLAPGELTMGRGWGVAKGRSQDVTERVLAASAQAASSDPSQ